MDITVQEQVEEAIKDTVADERRLDFLFNNAGVGGTLPFEDATLEDWKTIIDTNLWSVIYGVHTAVPIMLKQGFGHIINTSSVAGIIPFPFQALYSLQNMVLPGSPNPPNMNMQKKAYIFQPSAQPILQHPSLKNQLTVRLMMKRRSLMMHIPLINRTQHLAFRASEYKGIIIVPEEPTTEGWKNYVLRK